MKRVLLGTIVGSHGLKGWVKLRSFTEDPEAIFDYALTDESGKSVSLIRCGLGKDHFLASLPGVADRNTADAMRGAGFYVDRAALPEPDDEDILIEDLIGLTVRLENGETCGTVKAVHNFGAGDILEITSTEGKDELYSFSEANFPELDFEARVIVFSPPEILSARDE